MKLFLFEILAISLLILFINLRFRYSEHIPDTDLIQGLMLLMLISLVALALLIIPAVIALRIRDKYFPNKYTQRTNVKTYLDFKNLASYFLSWAILFLAEFSFPDIGREDNSWINIITIIATPLFVIQALRKKMSAESQIYILAVKVVAAVVFTLFILSLIFLGTLVI